MRPIYGPLWFSFLIMFKDFFLLFGTAETQTCTEQIKTSSKHGLTCFAVAAMVNLSSKKVLDISSVSQAVPSVEYI